MMTLLVNATQMKKCDDYTIETIGIPAMVLMERAALAVTSHILETKKYDLSQVLVVVGAGNNGGDGYAIARLLHLAGISVTLWEVGEATAFTKETAQQAKICDHYQIPRLHRLDSFMGYTLLVDAYLGIGVTGQLRGPAAEIIERIGKSRLPVVAVDIPSGIDASTGESLGAYLQAGTTITFQFKKIAFTVSPGMEACGNLIVADVGISDEPLH